MPLIFAPAIRGQAQISGGSRSERGAKATAVLMSVMRKARQKNLPIFETFKELLMAV